MTSENFVKQCQQAIDGYSSGKLSLREAAGQINNSPNNHLSTSAHLMLDEIADIAFYIFDELQTPEADQADWQKLKATLDNYIAGDWAPTSHILTMIYGEFDNDKQLRGFSVAVRRRNGRTKIDAATKDLSAAIQNIVKLINVDQTDRRYLQNVAFLAPQQIGNLKLTSTDITEHLDQWL